MDKFEIKTEGFAELESQLHDLANGYRHDLVARNTLVKAGKVAMEPVLNTLISLAPYDELHNTSGIHLRNTARINSRIVNDVDRASPMINETDAVISVVSVKRSAVSLSQEYGNVRTVAQPYLRISLERNTEVVLSILKSQLGQIIPDYWKSLKRRGIK